MPKIATIRDVAKRAGVSVATVSRVVNGTANVSEEPRQRVWEAIEALNYSPSALARGLSTRVSRTIGVCVPNIGKHPFWAEVVNGIEEICHQRGYNLFLCNSSSDPQRERDNFRLLAGRRVDGIVVGSLFQGEAHLKSYLERHWPVVLVDRRPLDYPLPAVIVDKQGATLSAVRYLVEMGHRRIGIVAGPPHHQGSDDHLLGYRQALRQHDMPLDPRLIQRKPYATAAAMEATEALLALPDRPTAIVCCSGRLAKGILALLQERGMAMPETLSLLTFDDYDWMTLVNPPLTAIAQPTVAMGARAV